MVDTELFGKIHKIITTHPAMHDQHTWEATDQQNRCGTTRCVAGWAVLLKAEELGLRPEGDALGDPISITVRERLAQILEVSEDDVQDHDDHFPTDFGVLGAAALGLDAHTAWFLFHDMNRERVVARVRSFADTGRDLDYEECERFDR